MVPTTVLVSGTAIEITLNEMKNPDNASGSSSFTIKTFEVDSGTDYIIDSVTTGLTLIVNCNYPCLTCGTSDKSSCSS